MSAPPIIQLEGVRKAFHDGARRRDVLAGVDLAVSPGELVALVGASGCGKTTLLNILGGLDGDFEGEAKLLGRSFASLQDDDRTRLRNERIGFVFQSFHLLEHLTVIQNVEVPMWLHAGRLSDVEEEARAKESLAVVGLGDRYADSVRPLSGGERQRVAIARALVNRPTLLLADEPTGNLDRETGRSIYALFDRVRGGDKNPSGCAVIVATHDVELARTADRLLTLAGGKLTELRDEVRLAP